MDIIHLNVRKIKIIYDYYYYFFFITQVILNPD